MSGQDELRTAAEKGRMMIGAVRAFRNWPIVLAVVAGRRIGWIPGEWRSVTRRGVVVTSPGFGAGYWPILEVFAGDAYGLARILADLGSGSPVVLDIGAHIGSLALQLASVHPTARIVCYEPSRSGATFCRRNIAANQLGTRIRVVEAAVGPTAGTAILTSSGPADCEATTSHSGERAGVQVGQVAIGDAIADAGGWVDLIKMDCEGAEHAIICETSPALWTAVAAIVLEYHPGHRTRFVDLRQRLETVGLRLVWDRADRRRSELGTAYFARVMPGGRAA